MDNGSNIDLGKGTNIATPPPEADDDDLGGIWIIIKGHARPGVPFAGDGKDELYLRWSNGELMGDTRPVEGLRMLALEQDGYPVGPIPAAYSVTDHLSNPLSFQILVSEWFAEGYSISGNPPAFPKYDPDLIY